MIQGNNREYFADPVQETLEETVGLAWNDNVARQREERRRAAQRRLDDIINARA
jgi:hypothetical protein